MRTVVYKGLFTALGIDSFYWDFNDPMYESDFAIFHQRYSTNTFPSWDRAQPARMLAHNGEINTIQGNRYWAEARSYKFQTPLIPDMEAVRPIVSTDGSDSMSLDNMLEALLMGGMDVFRAMRLLIPPAWQNVDTIDAELRAFYELMAPRIQAVIESFGDATLEELQGPEQRLHWLTLSLAEVAFAVEKYDAEGRVPYAIDLEQMIPLHDL